MDIRAHRWWERYKKSSAQRVRLGLWTGSHIVAELAHRKTLLETFFPGAVIDINELKALVMGTASSSDSQLSVLVEETSEQLIERLKRRDARFNYQLVVTPENNPVATAPGIVFSVTHGRTTINAFARDREALKLDPPKFSFEPRGLGVQKMRTFIETGEPQVLGKDEMGKISSTFGLFNLDDSPLTLSFGAASTNPSAPPLPLRLVFGKGENAVVYDYLPFRVVNVGTIESKIASVSNPKEPFEITVSLRKTDGTFTFEEKPDGFSLSAAHKWIRALKALQSAKHVEAYDLATGRRCLSGQLLLGDEPSYLSRYESYFREGTEISDCFGSDLRMRVPMTEEDKWNFHFLSQLMVSGPIDLGVINTTCEREIGNDDFIEKACGGEPLGLHLDNPGYSVALMGVDVPTGPFSLFVNVRPADPAALKLLWKSAAIGSILTMTWEPVSAATFTRGVCTAPQR